jgi:hypothetical protein
MLYKPSAREREGAAIGKPVPPPSQRLVHIRRRPSPEVVHLTAWHASLVMNG